jgi:hypothetical protein
MKITKLKVPTSTRRALTLLVAVLVIHQATSLFTSMNCPADCLLCNDDAVNNYCIQCSDKFFVKNDGGCENLAAGGSVDKIPADTFRRVVNYDDSVNFETKCLDYFTHNDSFICKACDSGFTLISGHCADDTKIATAPERTNAKNCSGYFENICSVCENGYHRF